MSPKPLTDRAKARLKIAAGFLRQRGVQFPKTGDFYGLVIKSLNEQPDRDELRGIVDWVEEYDAALAKYHPESAPAGSRRPAP